MPWSNGSAGNPAAIPPVLPVASDTERIRDLFNMLSRDLPMLRSAMTWLELNNPDGITTVQLNLAKADGNFTALEGIYSAEDYAITKLDVVEIDIHEQSTGAEVLRQRYKEKIWAALSLDGYFCKEEYLGHGQYSAHFGRS